MCLLHVLFDYLVVSLLLREMLWLQHTRKQIKMWIIVCDDFASEYKDIENLGVFPFTIF